MSSEIRPPNAPSRQVTLALAVLAALGSIGLFAYRLDDESLFVDEAAFLSQAYFGDLYFGGRTDSPLWLEYPAYDLPPLPKYLINLSLRSRQIARPGREWMVRWYRQTNEKRFVTPENLRAARLPSVLLGGLGCAALFAIGTMTIDRRVGFLSALFLAINPLYRLHARRAMADIPSEAFLLITLAVGLVLIRSLSSGRRMVVLSIAAGFLGGLAVLAKLNGGLGLMILSSWIVAVVLSSNGGRR